MPSVERRGGARRGEGSSRPPGGFRERKEGKGGVDTGQAKAVWLLCRIRRQLIERSSVAGHQLVHVHASVTEWRMYKTQAHSDSLLRSACPVIRPFFAASCSLSQSILRVA